MAVAGIILSIEIPWEHTVIDYVPVELTYELVSNLTKYEKTDFLFFKSMHAKLALKNIDSVSGEFGTNFHINGNDGIGDVKTVRHTIQPGIVEIFDASVPNDSEVSYSLIISKKLVPTPKRVTEMVPLWKYIFVTLSVMKEMNK